MYFPNYNQRSEIQPNNYAKAQRFMPIQSKNNNLSLQSQIGPQYMNVQRQRYTPYYSRFHANSSTKSGQFTYPHLVTQQQQQQQQQLVAPPPGLNISVTSNSNGTFQTQDGDINNNVVCSSLQNDNNNPGREESELDQTVTLQISNLDSTIDERILRQHLMAKLRPITPILSLVFDGLAVAKIRLPSQHHAKQVVAYLHRKKIGHKRIIVSYTRDSSSLEPSTLRCQVAGLLKDMPNYKLPLYKFRELFQSRFKTSISVMDLYEMKDICIITDNPNEEKSVVLCPDLIHSIENSELMDFLQHSVPYCTIHFKKGHRGWAEQDIEPLPNVCMTVSQVRSIVFALLKSHKEEIPIASLVYCIQGELNVKIQKNENGVNLEHLISCVNGVQITTNKFGIKILSWLAGNIVYKDLSEDILLSRYSKFGSITDPFSQISREIIELIKLSPKSTLKFSRFIPAYHNHFGKQCRVADYGYTKLIELFEALTSIVQIMGDGENRQITLTHKCQARRFTTDLMRILRTQANKSVLLSHLSLLFQSTQLKKFDITDYGVCDIEDILDGLITSNVVVVETLPMSDDMLISLPKRKQSRNELYKTSIFAGEVVELFRNASQFTIPFEKFACSYNYHFGYQCRLSDYGYQKLADLMEAITGIVEIEFSNEEDRKIFISSKVAQRIFSEQLRDIVKTLTGSCSTLVSFYDVLNYHKNEFGYQIQPQALGFDNMWFALKSLPYIEVICSNKNYFLICHHEDTTYRMKCYASIRILIDKQRVELPLNEFINIYYSKYNEILTEQFIESMHHALQIQKNQNGLKIITISKLMLFVTEIISILQKGMNVMTISDLKGSLNLSLSDTFPFGYPNLPSLLQSFPDIFVPIGEQSNLLNDLSEITINKDCILADVNAQELNAIRNCNDGNAVDTAGAGFVLNMPLPETNPILMSNTRIPFASISNCQMDLQQNRQNNRKVIDGFSTANLKQTVNESINNIDKDKISCQENMDPYNNLLLKNYTKNYNIQNNDDQLVMEPSTSTFGNHIRLYERKSSNSNASIIDLIKKPIKSGEQVEDRPSLKRLLQYFDPPKPDTPPVKVVPYWLDPVWVDYPESPLIESLNIPIPELDCSKVSPKLDTPTVIGSLAKTKFFRFD